MPFRALACFVAALVALGAGCGGSDDEEDVRSVVSSYVEASLTGNGRQACAFYTPELRRQTKREARKHGLRHCAEVVGRAVRTRIAQLPDEVRGDVEDAFSDPDELRVHLADDAHARAALEIPHGVMTDPKVMLVRTHEGWRIQRVGGVN